MISFKTNDSLKNEEVDQYLERIINSKLFTNGYIFFGTEGIGKKQKAIQFIKGIFKEYSSFKNIEERIINNNHPDLLTIEPGNLIKKKNLNHTTSEIPKNRNQEIIKVDQIRNIKTFLGQKSIESEKKVVLIIDAHLLNEAASNCLLKTLEEPSNGIFILITSKLNLLLSTIKSRCQLVRFKSFSSKKIETFLKNSLNTSKLLSYRNINLQDLINSANGSPGKILDNINILNEFPEEIEILLDSPLKEPLEILKFSKLISEKLEIFQQIFLVNFIQQIWWRKTRDRSLVTKLESLKKHIDNNVQPRLAWEVTLLKIAMED